MAAAAHPDARPTPAPAPTSAYVNLSKQAKYVALGGAGVWYWQIVPHLQDILSNPGWPFNLALLSLAILVATIAIFAHLMLLGASRTPPDYARWHQDPALRSIIPLLTLCIVAGYLSLALTLSPLVAPAPPSASLSSRLLLTAQSLGANLQTATSGTQLLLSDLRRSLPSRDLLSALRLPNAEALARRLGVPAEQGGALLASLETAQGRAQSWKENNVSALGWIGAVAGAGSAYVLVFGVVGLVGLVAMPTRKVRAE